MTQYKFSQQTCFNIALIHGAGSYFLEGRGCNLVYVTVCELNASAIKFIAHYACDTKLFIAQPINSLMWCQISLECDLRASAAALGFQNKSTNNPKQLKRNCSANLIPSLWKSGSLVYSPIDWSTWAFRPAHSTYVYNRNHSSCICICSSSVRVCVCEL